MFTLQHFIWLAICIAIVVLMLFIHKKYKLSLETVTTIMIVMSVCSEVTKILCNMMDAPGDRTGKILDPGDLPFHLCSIQIFLLFFLKFVAKTDETKKNVLGFMCPTMFIGAIMALLIPTVGVGFNVVQVYQYFIFHAFLIFFGIYIVKEKFVDWTVKVYLKNLAYLGCIALVVMWINSALSGVLPRVNFMYLVRPPMENLPVLNLDNGWGFYLATLITLVVVLTAIFQVIVMAINGKFKRKEVEIPTKTN